MHVLLTNDDGPLDDKACPYMKYLVDEIIKSTDWELSIVVPNQQRSWIGKAHFAGKKLTSSYIYTQRSTESKSLDINAFDGPYETPQERDSTFQEWCLLDSTPAACADIGLHHLYREKPPIDLVLSGPNFGKNSSNLYIMTSGTVGAAIEAVTHGAKAIALSYAFNNLDHDFDILKEAAKISVKLVAKLYKELQLQNGKVDLYSINIPLIESLKLGQTKIHYAPILENYWNSIYEPCSGERGQQQFLWNPDFKKVHKDSLKDTLHTDSRVLLDEGISVTPLKATFNVVQPNVGEIILDEEDEEESKDLDISKLSLDSTILLITLPEEAYISPAIKQAFEKHFPRCSITTDASVLSKVPTMPTLKVFHYGDYEELDIDLLSSHPDQYFVCSYIYRKALIRKHFLANTIHHYVAKNPTLALKTAVPESYQLEVDYAEFLDDALDDCYELREELEMGEKTWIVKPSMSDKGQGIRIFKSVEQLQAIFDLFEEDNSDDEDVEINEDEDNNGVIISQLRHFVVQEYQSNPLLLSHYDNKKFHLRTYIVCNGDLKVFVYKNILSLFAESSFKSPQPEDIDVDEIPLTGHLTNTCLQEGTSPLVVPFWDLQGLSQDDKEKVFRQVCQVTGELFKAAVNIDKMNFQPLSNGCEVFGIDFLVSENLDVTLLEVNSYPDFKQTGDDLKGLIFGLFEQVFGAIGELVEGRDNLYDPSILVPVLEQVSHGW